MFESLISLVFFCLSFFVATISVIGLQKLLNFSKEEKLFSFIPIILLYVTSISFFLSIASLLTGFNFLLIQILTAIVLKFVFHADLSLTNFLDFKIRKIYWPFVLILFLLFFSLLIRMTNSLTEFDDHMYRGSTPLYWLQNKSILPFETINERKSVFIFTSGAVFMWPLLFGANEIVALTFFWLSFPATVLLLYYSFFKNKVDQKLSYLFILSFICSPLIFYYFTNSLMQELWLAPVLLSYVVCLQKLLTQKKISENLIIICAVSLAILVSIKINTIVYALLILPLIFKKGSKILPFLFNFAKVFLITVMLSGYLFVAVKNLYSLGSPMGSPDFVKTHAVVLSAPQIFTHLVRIPFVFFDPPLFRVEWAQSFSSAVNSLAVEAGATRVLKGEDTEVWISKFEYRNNWPNTRFGMLGILVFWLSIYIIYKRTNILLSVFFLLIVVQLIFIRWAEGSGLPYRHLISVFPSLLLLLGISLKNGKLEKILTINASLIAMTIVMVGTLLIGSQRLILMKRDFTDYKSIKPENILIIEEQDTPDYSYFFSNGCLCNKIFLFGKRDRLRDPELKKEIDQLMKAKKIDRLIFNHQDIGLMNLFAER